MAVEAIAVDIDGTITDEKRRICISAIEALRKVEKAGIPVTIVTGNVVNYAYATEVLIGCSGGIVAENGGVVFKEGENDNAVETLVERDFVTSAEKHLKEKLSEKFEMHSSHDNMYRLTETVFYKTIPREEIEEALKDFEYPEQLEIYDSGFALHITDKRVNKGTSLRYLCERNGISMENVMAIGDSENDEDFLKESGYKIAVGNAEDKLKEISTYTCEKTFGDGVAEAIEKFVLWSDNMIYEIAENTKNEVKNICDAYEIYIEETKSIELDSEKDELNFVKEEIERGVGIRVIKDNKIGFAFTSNLDKIAETAQQAVENTKLNKTDTNYAFAEVDKVPEVKKVYDPKFDNLDLDECVEFTKNFIVQTVDKGCDITGARFSASGGKSLIVNSNGVSIENKETGFGASLSVIVQKDGKIATAYDSASSRFFDLNGEKLVDDVCNLAKSSLDTKPVETDNYSVALDYSAAVGLLDTFMNAFDGESVRRGRSIFQDKIGQEVSNPNLTIIDNPLVEKGMRTTKCDDEGSASQKTELIKDGILNSFVYDIYTANKVGTETTSNGFRGSYLTTPMIGLSNLEFKFKESKDISEIDKGVLTTNVLGAHTANPISGDFSVEASNAFKIENGELTDPINKAMISGNVFEIMKKVEALNTEIKQYGAYIIPKLLVHDLRVVGNQ